MGLSLRCYHTERGSQGTLRWCHEGEELLGSNSGDTTGRRRKLWISWKGRWNITAKTIPAEILCLCHNHGITSPTTSRDAAISSQVCFSVSVPNQLYAVHPTRRHLPLGPEDCSPDFWVQCTSFEACRDQCFSYRFHLKISESFTCTLTRNVKVCTCLSKGTGAKDSHSHLDHFIFALKQNNPQIYATVLSLVVDSLQVWLWFMDCETQ